MNKPEEHLVVRGALLPVIKQVVSVAVRYQKLTGRKLGITGEVGELFAAQRLNLRLVRNPIAQGFDAIDRSGKRVQIKARRAADGPMPKPGGRVGSFSKHEFDYALLVILSDQYEIVGIWKLDHKRVDELARKHKRRNPSIASFIKIAKRIFPKT